MANNPRINPDVFYVNGVAIPATYFRSLDTAQTAGLDGDNGGGTWNPSSAINVGGAGMWAGGPWTIQPPAGYPVQVPITSSAPLMHSDSDYITLATGHNLASRLLITQMTLGKDSSGCPTFLPNGPFNPGDSGIIGSAGIFLPSAGFGGLGNTPLTGYAWRPGGRFVCPLRVHNGATLVSVTFRFVITPHTSIANLVFPQFRVHKVDLFGNLTPLYTGGQSSGFVPMAAPANFTIYNALTSVVYFCDPSVVIDTSKYSYFVEVIDESNAVGGTAALPGNIYTTVVASYQLISDMRPQ